MGKKHENGGKRASLNPLYCDPAAKMVARKASATASGNDVSDTAACPGAAQSKLTHSVVAVLLLDDEEEELARPVSP
jgi:hypothetical protein